MKKEEICNGWQKKIEDFLVYLGVERSLSSKTIEAYRNDISKFAVFVNTDFPEILPEKVEYEHLDKFVLQLNPENISPRSQARLISGIRAFFKFLLMDDSIETNPAKLIETPRIGRKIPDILSVEEIDTILATIDMSKTEGYRNCAIIETLYSCGLRVSELNELRLNHLYFEEKFIRVRGKGDKERLVPISKKAIKDITNYINFVRNKQVIKKGFESYVFLNKRGEKLSRISIFSIVKELAELAGIKKNISPHTFRHSFATHLVEGGANLKVVQDMLGHESIITTEIYSHLNSYFLFQELMLHHPLGKLYKK